MWDGSRGWWRVAAVDYYGHWRHACLEVGGAKVRLGVSLFRRQEGSNKSLLLEM
jgi:hypothetical protein